MKNKEQVVFHGHGEQTLTHSDPGDIVFALRQRKHHKFRRVAEHLYTDIQVSFKESVLGFKRDIKTLDGRTLKVEIAGAALPVKPFGWHTISKEGMPILNSWGGFGDLHIRWMINFPKSLTPKQKQFVKEIFPISEDEEDKEDETTESANPDQ